MSPYVYTCVHMPLAHKLILPTAVHLLGGDDKSSTGNAWPTSRTFFRIGRLKCNEQLRKVYHFGLSLKVVKAEKKAASLKAIVLSGWGVDQESGLKLTPPAATCFPGTKDVGPSSTCNKCDMQAKTWVYGCQLLQVSVTSTTDTGGESVWKPWRYTQVNSWPCPCPCSISRLDARAHYTLWVNICELWLIA